MPASAARSASEVKAQLPALISACAVLVLGISTHQLATPAPLGPLSRHLAVHIALMNVAAPICAAVLWLAWPAARKPASGAVLWTATIGQMVLLWVWQATHAAAMPSPVAQTLWHSSLLLSALLFWRALVPASGVGWQSNFALLVTGKLVCLLARAIGLFATPALFPAAGRRDKHAIEHAAERPDLADQHERSPPQRQIDQRAGLRAGRSGDLGRTFFCALCERRFSVRGRPLGGGRRCPPDQPNGHHNCRCHLARFPRLAGAARLAAPTRCRDRRGGVS